jgi:ABC-type maltose transport system permease subunit
MSNMTAVQRFRGSATVQRRFGVGVRLVIALFLILFSIFPILWVVSASINPTGSLATQTLIPANPGLGNYRDLLTSQQFPFWTWFGNSLKIATITAVLSLSITTIAAYAFSRFRFQGRTTMLKAILLIQVFPSLLTLVAVFLMFSQIGDILPFLGLNQHNSLILVYLGGAMGVNIWLMKGFLDTVPRDIDESAMVEGGFRLADLHPIDLAVIAPHLDRHLYSQLHYHLRRVCPGAGAAQEQRSIHSDVGSADIHASPVCSKVGSICSRRVDRCLTDHDYLPYPTRSDCGRVDPRCSERVVLVL